MVDKVPNNGDGEKYFDSKQVWGRQVQDGGVEGHALTQFLRAHWNHK